MKVTDTVLAAGQRLVALFGEVCKVEGLTVQQARVLCAVHSQPGLSQTGLVAATGIDRSTIADVIRRMSAKGLVARQRGNKTGAGKPDQRAYMVMLTGDGKKVVRQARAAIEATERRLLADMPALASLSNEALDAATR